jgi:amino acid permease
MRKTNPKEHENISNLLLKNLKTEKMENILGFSLVTIFIIIATISMIIDKQTDLINVVPYFVTGAVLVELFFGWLLYGTLKDLNSFKKSVEKNKYKVQDCIAEDINIYMTHPNSAKYLSTRIIDKKGNLIDTSCSILNNVSFNDYGDFIEKNKNKQCLYIEVADNFKFVLF